RPVEGGAEISVDIPAERVHREVGRGAGGKVQLDRAADRLRVQLRVRGQRPLEPDGPRNGLQMGALEEPAPRDAQLAVDRVGFEVAARAADGQGAVDGARMD